MTGYTMPRLAICAKCGAWADLDRGEISLNMRDAAICENPPITECPDMKAAIENAAPKAPNE
jgi:hypothetical protein